MPPVGFEPAVLGIERPQTHALDRAATGIGPLKRLQIRFLQYVTSYLYPLPYKLSLK